MADENNQLIAGLASADGERLLALCERVHLARAQTIYGPGVPTTHVYFPTSGFISLIAETIEKSSVNVSMVGYEGMLGIHVTLGIKRSPLQATVQRPGSAWRIDIRPFQRELARSAELQRSLNQYLHITMVQLAASAACLHFHAIGPRLARWLLMSHDRARADHFDATHTLLAAMLGVRRAGITTAANALQRAGFISYRRGGVSVLDRAGLEGAACSCYETDRLARAGRLA